MIPNAERDPPRSANQEILENEQAMTYHGVNVFSICNRIMIIGREVITRGEFQEDITQMVILQIILAKARYVLQYKKQMRNKSVRST